MRSVHVIREEALSLSVTERAALAEELLVSLDPSLRLEVDAAWVEEAERRILAFEQGKSKTFTADEVRARFGIA